MAEDNINYLTCKNCGAQLRKISENNIACPYCGSMGIINKAADAARDIKNIDTTYHPILSIDEARSILIKRMNDLPLGAVNPEYLNFKIRPQYFPVWRICAHLKCQWQRKSLQSNNLIENSSCPEQYENQNTQSFRPNGSEDIELIFAISASPEFDIGQINASIDGYKKTTESIGFNPHDKTWEIVPIKGTVSDALESKGVQNYLNYQGWRYCQNKAASVSSVITSIVSYQSKCEYMPICTFEYEANGQKYQNLVNLFNRSVIGDIPIDTSIFINQMRDAYKKEIDGKGKISSGQNIIIFFIIVTLVLSICLFAAKIYILGIAAVIALFVWISKYDSSKLKKTNINMWAMFLNTHKESIARFILSQNSHAMKKLTSIYGESFAKSIHKYVARLADENRLGEIDIPIVNAIAHAELDLKDVADKFWQDLYQLIKIPN